MSAQRGSAFLLKVGNEEKSYATVAGLRMIRLAIDGEYVDVSQIGSKGTWRVIQDAKRSVGWAGRGIFTGSVAELEVRAKALAGSIDPYELSFEDGGRMRGGFLITKLEYVGDFNGERNYEVAMESSGEVIML